MEKLRYEKKQIVFIFIIVMFFFMLLGLNSRLSDLFRLSSYRNNMQAKVVSLRGTDIALKTQIAIATSDLAAEEWARDQAHMVLPGDQVIVPLSPNAIISQNATQFTPTPISVEYWQVWWDLFFSN